MVDLEFVIHKKLCTDNKICIAAQSRSLNANCSIVVGWNEIKSMDYDFFINMLQGLGDSLISAHENDLLDKIDNVEIPSDILQNKEPLTKSEVKNIMRERGLFKSQEH